MTPTRASRRISYREALERHTDKRLRLRFAVDYPPSYYIECITTGTAWYVQAQGPTRSHWVVPITDEWAAVVVYDEARSAPATVLQLEWYKGGSPTRLLEAWLDHKAKLADPAYRENRAQWAVGYLDRRCAKRLASALSFVGRFRRRKF
jgi:hypothetical protein